MQQCMQADVEWQAVDASNLRHAFCRGQGEWLLLIRPLMHTRHLFGACAYQHSALTVLLQSERCPACFLHLRPLLSGPCDLACLPLL